MEVFTTNSKARSSFVATSSILLSDNVANTFSILGGAKVNLVVFLSIDEYPHIPDANVVELVAVAKFGKANSNIPRERTLSRHDAVASENAVFFSSNENLFLVSNFFVNFPLDFLVDVNAYRFKLFNCMAH